METLHYSVWIQGNGTSEATFGWHHEWEEFGLLRETLHKRAEGKHQKSQMMWLDKLKNTGKQKLALAYS